MLCALPDRPAAVVHAVVPEIPGLAEQQGIYGIVRVRVSVDAAGSVRDVLVVQSPSRILNEVSIRAASPDDLALRSDGRLQDGALRAAARGNTAPMIIADDLASQLAGEQTPRRIFRPQVARERLDLIVRLRGPLGRPPLALVAAFSFKTNPRAELVEEARARGFFAEVISHDELEWAGRMGFAPEETIYNGPEPLLEGADDRRLAYVFADSLEALDRNLQRSVAAVNGVRLRPSMIASRFGIPIEDEPDLIGLVRAMPAEAPLAVSFHARHGDYKGAGWRDVAVDVLDRAVELEIRTGRRVAAFDVGGGWTPEEFDANFQADMGWLVERISAALPSCTHLIFESGQAVCTPTEALLTEVLEVRRRIGRSEVIVDVGYSDWPEMHEYPHAMFAWRDNAWLRLGHGPDRLGGRTCLEYDQIEGLRFPADISVGERLLIADTGSYDHSMAFQFARGGARHAPLRD